MSAVEQAAAWARELTRREARGPGDLRNAWRRLEMRYGVSARTFWALRYRRPKDILASTWLRLGAAYRAECERHLRMLRHDIEITKASKAGPLAHSVRSAVALVDETDD